MRLLIIRHADPEYVTDSLTPDGVKQADALARRLASGHDGQITRLYTSPKGRAKLTAKPTEKLLNKVASIEDWTKELSHWPRLILRDEDKPNSKSDTNIMAKPGEGALAVWDIPGDRVRGASSSGVTNHSQWSLIDELSDARYPFEQLQLDSDTFLARHGYVREGHHYRIVSPNRQIIVVFCHGGFGLTWIAHLLNIPVSVVWSSFYLAPSSVTTILFDERNSDFACPRAIGIGDLAHLYKEDLMPLPISKYERPNVFGDWKRPSGVKANFW